MQAMKKPQQLEELELTPLSFERHKEQLVHCVLETMRNTDIGQSDKNEDLRKLLVDLRRRRARLEHINKQLKLSLISGSANNTHH